MHPWVSHEDAGMKQLLWKQLTQCEPSCNAVSFPLCDLTFDSERCEQCNYFYLSLYSCLVSPKNQWIEPFCVCFARRRYSSEGRETKQANHHNYFQNTAYQWTTRKTAHIKHSIEKLFCLPPWTAYYSDEICLQFYSTHLSRKKCKQQQLQKLLLEAINLCSKETSSCSLCNKIKSLPDNQVLGLYLQSRDQNNSICWYSAETSS